MCWPRARAYARILEGVATGLTSVQLASQLYLSHQGISYHIGAMIRRFDVANRTALASKAFASGIFRMDCWPPRVLPDHIMPKAARLAQWPAVSNWCDTRNV